MIYVKHLWRLKHLGGKYNTCWVFFTCKVIQERILCYNEYCLKILDPINKKMIRIITYSLSTSDICGS